MKVYAIIITVIAVLVLGVAGYEFQQHKKVSDDLNSTQVKLDGIKEQYKQPAENINRISQILGKTSNSFMHPGVMQVSSFNQPVVDEINKDIAGIQNTSTRDDIKSNWDKFVASKTINDYRSFVQSVSNAISGESDSLGTQ